MQPRNLVLSPIGNLRRQKGLKEFSVVGNTQMQQFVGNDKILEPGGFVCQIQGQGDDS